MVFWGFFGSAFYSRQRFTVCTYGSFLFVLPCTYDWEITIFDNGFEAIPR
jgi:hypothetical protein